jgi:hypothetical protein
MAYQSLAPAALLKLESKKGDPWKITNKEIMSISVFLTLEVETKKKNYLVKALMQHINKDPKKIAFQVAVVVPVGAPRAPAAWDYDEEPFYVGVELCGMGTNGCPRSV